MKSKVIERGTVNWGKNLVIDRLFFDFDAHNKRIFVESLRATNPDITLAEIEEACAKEVIEENAQILAIDEIASAYKIELDQEDIQNKLQEVKEHIAKMNARGANITPSEQHLTGKAEMLVYKDVIYADLAEKWGLQVSPEETRIFLEGFCDKTGQNIEDFVEDSKIFERIREDLQDFKVSQRIKEEFTTTVKVEKYRRYWEKFQEEAAQAKS